MKMIRSLRSVYTALVQNLFVLLLGLLFAASAGAQNILATVAPNSGGSDNSVDILNPFPGGNWYFYSNPTPAAARMSMMDSAKISESPWGTVGQFWADPNQSGNRIFPGKYLRVYPKTLAVGSVINVEFAYGPAATRYQFQITVTTGQQVTSMPILDPSPTAAATVRWRVNFSAPISGVTAANFNFTNAANITGVSIASVVADTAQPSSSWTVTANTGSGVGLLGLNWTGHVTETPSVPNSFSGHSYDFSFLPTISADPVSVAINRNSTATLTVTGALRNGGTPNYQWYSGSSVNPGAATAISGATGPSYTTPTQANTGSFSYFCRVFTIPNNYRDSMTAIVTVVDPPVITAQPTSGYIATGRTRALSVTATGTSLTYQWYRGNAPSTANPVGTSSSSFTTPALTANTNYWVRLSNAGPTVVNSNTVTVGVVASLTAGASYSTTVNTAFPTALSAVARDPGNVLIPGITLTFTAPSGVVASGRFPGVAVSTTAVTNASGVAIAPTFTATTLTGNFNVAASFDTLSINLACTNVPAAPASLFLATAPGATAVAGTAFSPQPVIHLRDAFGNLCTNNSSAILTASRQSGSGTLQGTLSATASGGVVTFSNLNHTAAGVITVGFATGTLTGATGNITILPGAPATLATANGAQTAAPNAAFPTALGVSVTDAFGNPVPATAVNFTAPSSGASATFPNATAAFSTTTNASGLATAAATANGISGSYQAVASVAGVAQPVNFSLKNETAADAWRQSNFGTILHTGTSSDHAAPFGDNVPNLHKFAFNLVATGADNISLTPAGTSGLPSLVRTAPGSFDLYFLRRKAATNPGIAYLPEISSDLAGYSAVALGGAAVTSINASWERVRLPMAAGNRAYVRVRVPYLRDFNSGLGSATLRGSAALNTGAVRLTPASVNQTGAVVLEGIAQPAAPTGFTANFTVSVAALPGNTPAEGLGFAVGDLGTAGWGEGGPAGGNNLTVGIDTLENNTGLANSPGLHIRVNGTHVARAAIVPDTTGAVIPVEISYDASTGVTVKYNGVTHFSNIAVPAFVFTSASRYGIGARTGGFFQTTTVDDIMIAPR